MFTVLDLFSGIGGFSLGLEKTGGFRTVAFCEIDPYCRAVLDKHWRGTPCYTDVAALSADRLDQDGIGRIDVICGGFPCQDVSLAGAGAGLAGQRSGLWFEYLRLIGEIRPRYVIVENVSGLLSRGLDTILGNLAEIGYDAEWHAIPASHVGAPHRRDRVWIVAYPGGEGRRQELRSAYGDESSDARGAAQHLHEFGSYGQIGDVADSGGQRGGAGFCEAQSLGDGPVAADGGGDVADGHLHVGIERRSSDAGEGARGRHADRSTVSAHDMADSDFRRREELGQSQHGTVEGAPGCESDGCGQGGRGDRQVPHLRRELLEGWGGESAQGATQWEPESAICRVVDGISEGLDSAVWLEEWEGVPRVCQGVANRVSRLQSLGNAVVPQVVTLLGYAILAHANEIP